MSVWGKFKCDTEEATLLNFYDFVSTYERLKKDPLFDKYLRIAQRKKIIYPDNDSWLELISINRKKLLCLIRNSESE